MTRNRAARDARYRAAHPLRRLRAQRKYRSTPAYRARRNAQMAVQRKLKPEQFRAAYARWAARHGQVRNARRRRGATAKHMTPIRHPAFRAGLLERMYG